jgi:hypothetical protein
VRRRSSGGNEEKAELRLVSDFQECDAGRVARDRGFATLAGSLECFRRYRFRNTGRLFGVPQGHAFQGDSTVIANGNIDYKAPK